MFKKDIFWFCLGILGTLLVATYCYYLVTGVYEWVEENAESTPAAIIYATAFGLLSAILCIFLLTLNVQTLRGWNMVSILRLLRFSFHSWWIIAVISTAAYLFVTNGLFNPPGVIALFSTILLGNLGAHYCARSLAKLPTAAAE